MRRIVNTPEPSQSMSRNRKPSDATLPPHSRRLYDWFMWYVRGYCRRHFHSIRLLKPLDNRPAVPLIEGESVLLYTNHPSWWDPLIFFLVAQKLYPDRMNYGPMDATALGRYSFLKRIGFLGIERDSWKGAARFLRFAKAAMERSDVLFWVTAQGDFVDPRQRPVEMKPGVGHAAANAKHGWIIPFAVEYPFWNERLPEALVAFGTPQRVELNQDLNAAQWNKCLAAALEETQNELRTAAISRDTNAFIELAAGTVGIGGVYDITRRIRSALAGKRFNPAHEEEPS